MKKALLFFTILFMLSTGLLAQQVNLVKDINNSANNYGSNPSYTVAFGGSVIFIAADPLTGSELWISNGTDAGTTRLKDIYPGGSGSYPNGLTNIGGTVYFSADDGANGSELWKTDGTPAGTVLVKDINPGPGGSSPGEFTLFNGSIYFRAYTAAEGSELWVTDGTAAGTLLIGDINAGSGSSYPSGLEALGTTCLIFQGYTPTDGSELHSYNGTAFSKLDIVPNAGGSNPYGFTYNSALGLIFFTATDATNGTELWKTNGNFGTGTSVIDIVPGAGSSYPSNITSAGSNVFFQTYTATYGYELWKSNGGAVGTGTLIVADIAAGSASSSPYNLTATGGGGLFFFAYDATNGYAMRFTTGTSVSVVSNTAGLSLYQMIPNPSSANVYFSAYTSASGYELWTATSAAATMIKDIVPGTGSSYPYWLVYTGTIFFSADGGTTGNELWRSDLTLAGTVQVKDINSATDSNIYGKIATTSGFLISANDGVNGQELWKTDGTGAGTALVKDILSGMGGSNPQFLGRLGSNYLFSAYDNTNGQELWITDGTAAGTALVKDIEPGIGGSYPYQGVVMGSNLYFVCYTATYGYELWRSNGTTSGTSIVQDIYSGNFSSYPYNLITVGSSLYFSADDGTNGNELWKSDGTTASMVKNINVSGSSYPYNFTNVNGTLFFTADDGVNGNELWKSDGTSAGTLSPKDIFSGSGSSYPFNIAAMGSTAYFVANDGTNGYELWKSDGTLAGTALLKDIYAGAGNSSYPGNFTLAGAKLYFTAYEPAVGTELWSTDGSAANTVMVKDLRAGSASSNPQNLTDINGSLYFNASDGSGNLLFKSNGATAFRATSAGIAYDNAGTAMYYNGKVIFTANTNTYGNEPFSIMAEPLNQPTALNFTGRTATTISASFTAAAGTPSGYIVLRKAGSTPTDLPIDGAPYTVGAAIGTSTVAAIGSGTSFTDNFAASSSPSVHYYAVFSYNNDGVANIYRPYSPLQGNSTPFAAEPAAQPTGFTVSSPTTTSFTVSFTAATGSPTGYLVLRKAGTTAPSEVPVDGTGYTAGSTLGGSTVAFVGSTPSFAETGFTAGQTFSYAVFSYNGATGTYNYLGAAPLTGTATTLVNPPSAQPTALVFSSVQATSMTISWTAAAGPPDGYIVIRKAGSAPTGTPANGTTYTSGQTAGDGTVVYSGTGTTANDTGLSPATLYFYQVFSYNGSGSSTNYLTASPLSGNNSTLDSEPVVQPTSLVFSNVSFTSLTVSFTASASAPVTGYIVIRNMGSAPTGIPEDGVVYTAGGLLGAGTGTVAYAGSSTTFAETGLTNQTIYHYAVYAYNNAAGPVNYLTVSPLTNNVTTLTPDSTPPVVSNTTSSSVVSGFPAKITATVSDAESGIASVLLEYRSISGNPSYTSVPMVSVGSNNWDSPSILAAEVGDIGLEFKISATNGQNLTTNSATFKTLVSFADQNLDYIAFGSEVINYRIISVPLNLTNKSVTSVFGDDLNEYNNTVYRIFHFENGSNKELNSTSTIELGKGYWFIAKTQKTLDTGPGTAANVTIGQPYTFNLVSGWNQIGNPYLFNVSWADVLAASGNISLNLRTYDGTFRDANILNKFEGGFVFANAATTITFPTTKNSSANGRMKSGNEPLRNSIDMPEWDIPFRLVNGGIVNELAGVGMRPSAKDDFDKFDDFTLPRLFEYLELNHQKSFLNTAYSKDIVPTSDNKIWEFSVDSNLKGETELEWDNSYFGDNQKQIVLLDIDRQQSINMRQTNSYRFNGSRRTFKIIFGDPDFVRENSLADGLMINLYPNPAESAVTIGFTTPDFQGESKVKVKVTSLLGQSLIQLFDGLLTAGYHELKWDGSDTSGERASPGVYLVEIRMGNYSRIEKFVFK